MSNVKTHTGTCASAKADVIFTAMTGRVKNILRFRLCSAAAPGRRFKNGAG